MKSIDEMFLCSGVNAVVTHDIENHTIVGGILARSIGKCDDRFVINKKQQEWQSQDA